MYTVQWTLMGSGLWLVMMHQCKFINGNKCTTLCRAQGFPGGASGKEFACQAGDAREVSLISGLGRSPGVGNGNALSPTPVFLPGKFHGQRSITGYSPWGHKDLDTAEWAHGKHSACVEAFVTSAQFCYEPKTFTKNEVYPLKTRDKEKVRITLRFLAEATGTMVVTVLCWGHWGRGGYLWLRQEFHFVNYSTNINPLKSPCHKHVIPNLLLRVSRLVNNISPSIFVHILEQF